MTQLGDRGATPAEVLRGDARWSVVEGSCEGYLWLDAVTRLITSARIIADVPYGTGAYPTDKPIADSTIQSWLRAKTLALFGWPEDLVELNARLSIALERPLRPAEWITWWAPNKCDPRANDLREAECIAIYGDVPGRKRITRPRSKVCRETMERMSRYPERRRPASGKARVSNGPIDVAQDGSVWRIMAPGMGFNAAQRLHPNEKPIDLYERLVLLCSEPGDVVFDPTSGSGTCGVAALRHGRRFVGIELDAAWAALAAERVAAEAAGTTLSAARAGQEALFR